MVAVSPDNESNNDKDIIFIPKSVGAKARNYDVLDPATGKVLNCQDICYTLRNTLLLPDQDF